MLRLVTIYFCFMIYWKNNHRNIIYWYFRHNDNNNNMCISLEDDYLSLHEVWFLHEGELCPHWNYIFPWLHHCYCKSLSFNPSEIYLSCPIVNFCCCWVPFCLIRVVDVQFRTIPVCWFLSFGCIHISVVIWAMCEIWWWV